MTNDYIKGFDTTLPVNGNTPFTAYAKGLAFQVNEPPPQTYADMVDVITQYSGDTDVTLLYSNPFTAVVLSRDSCIEVVNFVDIDKGVITHSEEIKS